MLNHIKGGKSSEMIDLEIIFKATKTSSLTAFSCVVFRNTSRRLFDAIARQTLGFIPHFWHV